MKRHRIRLAAICAFMILATASDASQHFNPDALRVVALQSPAHLDTKFPAIPDLWSLIPKDVEIPKFDDCTTEGWEDRLDVATRALVSKAKEAKLESAALARIFGIISAKDQKALLPLMALRAKLNGKEVWVVYFNWEDRPRPQKPIMTKDGLKFPEEIANWACLEKTDTNSGGFDVV